MALWLSEVEAFFYFLILQRCSPISIYSSVDIWYSRCVKTKLHWGIPAPSPQTFWYCCWCNWVNDRRKWSGKGGIWQFPLKDEEASTNATSGSSGASLWLTTHSTISSFGSQMWQHPTEQGKSFSLGKMAESQSCSHLLVQSNRDASKLLEGETAQTDQRQTSPSVCN